MNFKDTLRAGELIVGCFVKTPAPVVFEALSLTALDCLCLDGEHSPFDRSSMDGCVFAARASGKPILVRVQANQPEHILNALDLGATGVVVPHVRSVAEARAAVRAAHYGPGGRGFAGTPRAAGHGTRTMADHLARSAAETVVVAQSEDVEAIDCVDEIAQVEGIDALFVGRADLTVAYGASSPDDPRVIAAVDKACDAGRRHGRVVGMFLPRPADVPKWREKGASLFLLGSDVGFMMAGAADMLREAKGR